MGIEKKYQVIRQNISSYQGHQFAELERKHLEIIPEVLYGGQPQEDLRKIIITTSNTDISQLQGRDDIDLMIHPNSGYDNYPLDFVKNAKFPIIIGNKIRMNAVVSYIMSALFNHTSPIHHSTSWDVSRKWSRNLLSDRKILIIGNGHIGKRVELLLKTIGCSPIIHDPFKGLDNLDPTGVEVVIMACSLNPTSEGMINKDFLSKLAPYFLFINAARGKCVVQSDLIDSLLMNKRSHAYLDVFEEEPFDNKQFIGVQNITLTSHIAGVHNTLNTSILNFEWAIVNDFIHKCDTIEKFTTKYQDSLLQNKLTENYLI
ncbi:D-isomer specific 2-hydroxyacid dehydrogenase family protein [Halobacteriovorax sp. HLS]|uniref:NAD(P)-dependent oxidoreductase n=1 Tax=Halobacteriovorax sp. HLS TaxID=2234000 RepID=UPI0013E38047|nr:NAD(P)-dependent oxidoreductase [Halobacteriovorax sp. HLS]